MSAVHNQGFRTLIARAVTNEDGQDLIEYALLSAFIGICGIAGWAAIASALGTSYATRDANLQNEAVYRTPNPLPPPPQ